MTRSSLAVALAISLIVSPALAQSPSARAADQAPAPSARALELSHRLILAMHLTATFQSLMQSMTPQMIDFEAKQIPGFKPEWRQPMIEATQEAGEDLMSELLKEAEPIYAQTFTEEELAQATAFYESPTGQSMIRKSPQIAPLLMKNFQGLMTAMRTDTMTRFCKKIGGCDKAAGPADRPNPS